MICLFKDSLHDHDIHPLIADATDFILGTNDLVAKSFVKSDTPQVVGNNFGDGMMYFAFSAMLFNSLLQRSRNTRSESCFVNVDGSFAAVPITETVTELSGGCPAQQQSAGAGNEPRILLSFQ